MYKRAYTTLLNGILDAVELIEKSNVTDEEEILGTVSEKLRNVVVEADNIIIESEEEI
ncbi:MAG: hypothetical protein IJY74_01725 [Oscillospiraceae bacterium]|nr:hypothetical protein [Oscillospiraceae bacterium]